VREYENSLAILFLNANNLNLINNTMKNLIENLKRENFKSVKAAPKKAKITKNNFLYMVAQCRDLSRGLNALNDNDICLVIGRSYV
jgi:hypothetical protein